jgi:hypothetical protein
LVLYFAYSSPFAAPNQHFPFVGGGVISGHSTFPILRLTAGSITNGQWPVRKFYRAIDRGKSVIAGSGNADPSPLLSMDATHDYFGTLAHGVNQIGKTRKDCPFLGWTLQKLIKEAPAQKPLSWLHKTITETSLLPLNTLISSVKEFNN